MQSKDEFYYGRRQITRYGKTGQPSYTYLPLTQSDLLNPQPGDEFVHGERHDQTVQAILLNLRYHYRYNPTIAVLSQVQVVWPNSALAQPAPDILVIPNVSEPERARPQFVVAEEATQPTFVLEVTSPRFVDIDLEDKVTLYAQAGVREYFIVDTGERLAQAAMSYGVLGYRLEDGVYIPIAPDDSGRLYSQSTRLWFAPNGAQDGLLLIDKRTGKAIQPDADYLESAAAARAEAMNRAQNLVDQLDFLRNG